MNSGTERQHPRQLTMPPAAGSGATEGIPPAHRFAASLIERGSTGFAGYAAAALFERLPNSRPPATPDAAGAWRRHFTQRLQELSVALALAEPQLFVARVLWSAGAFRTRGQDADILRESLGALRGVLAGRLPAAARDIALAYLDQGLQVLAQAPAACETSALDPARPTDRLALGYLQRVLDGESSAAIAELIAAMDRGMDVPGLYLRVLLPAQREIGRLWHAGEVSVAEEHLVSATTRQAMAVLSSRAPDAPANGRCAIVAAVACDAHDIGPHAVADLYRLAGWRTIFPGADVPVDDFPVLVGSFRADVLLLGATMVTQLLLVQQAISAVRAGAGHPVKVLVGGAAFDGAPGIWRRLGADGHATTIDEALELGARLVCA